MTRKSKRRLLLIPLALFVIFVSAIGIRTFIVARSTPASIACLHILRKIDGAKQQWALENGSATNVIPSWNELRSYIGRAENRGLPQCPKGGTYILGRVGEPPRCSTCGLSP